MAMKVARPGSAQPIRRAGPRSCVALARAVSSAKKVSDPLGEFGPAGRFEEGDEFIHAAAGGFGVKNPGRVQSPDLIAGVLGEGIK